MHSVPPWSPPIMEVSRPWQTQARRCVVAIQSTALSDALHWKVRKVQQATFSVAVFTVPFSKRKH
jgi:hypothetical protein